jgi:Transposase
MIHPEQLKREVIAFMQGGRHLVEAERRFQVSRKTVRTWLNVAGVPQRPRASKVDREAVRARIEAQPDISRQELAQMFDVSEAAIHYVLGALRINIDHRLSSARESRAARTPSAAARKGARARPPRR